MHQSWLETNLQVISLLKQRYMFVIFNYLPCNKAHISPWGQLKDERRCWIILDFENVSANKADILFATTKTIMIKTNTPSDIFVNRY